ncbi:MAG: hypothetical protein WCH43_08865 [Verrucomicrobiota bacterium]
MKKESTTVAENCEFYNGVCLPKRRRQTFLNRIAVALLFILSVSPLFAELQTDDWRVLVSPDNSLSFMFIRGNERVLTTALGGWGPKWGWRPFESHEKASGDELVLTAPFEVNKEEGQVIQVKQRVWKSGDNEISMNFELSADKDVPLTMLVAHVRFDEKFQEGDILFKHADGTEGTLPLTIGGPGSQPETDTLVFRPKKLDFFSATIKPALPIVNHGALRIQLAADLFKAGKKSVTLTFHLPGVAQLLVKQSDIDQLSKVVPDNNWFPVTATKDVKPSVIGFEDWLDKPAGKHGGVRMVGDHFEFADKTRVKFWGTNLSYAFSAPEHQQAEYTAARFAKFGVNAVRMHKFTGAGWEGIGDENDATQMNPEGLDRLDYFANELAKNGVYYGWSHSFQFKVKPGNKDRLLAYDEIKANADGNTYSLMNWAEDCQDLLIETVVNLLKHKNPYTGKTYAEDPALAYIELQNEDDIFFFTTNDALNKFPTYKKNLMQRFAQWLQAKYKDQAGLKTAWDSALKPDETLEAKNIALAENVFEMGPALEGKTGGPRQRLLDNAAFYHAVQNAFYDKFSKAIRATGYKGPLVGSPWQTAGGLTHLYNLKSDYLVGYIDRHNYFGGAFNDSMLAKPGSGDFSTGLQQVADRPFGISEWVHQYPSLYSAEGPAIFAVYGMGLQGWDASYEFQGAQIANGFSDLVGTLPWGIWNVDVPTQIGQYPALARMIMRGDVKEGEVIGSRNVSPQNLADGKFDFSEKIVQQGDVKSFDGNTPPEALAAGRLVVKFTDKDEPSSFPDMTKYDANQTITSNTKQLTWDYSGKGYFTVNTAGTKAVVGFAQDRKLQLDNYVFSLQSPYASVFLTSLEKGKDLSQTKTALLTVVARNSNSGFKILSIDNRTLDNGTSPILLEPVKAAITCGRAVAAVNILDQDGQRTGQTLPLRGNNFEIDSSKEKTIYYEVVFK